MAILVTRVEDAILALAVTGAAIDRRAIWTKAI